jgi:hypothetical protein
MGEAKRKRNHRQRFLLDNPWCAYCGAPATTTDHCPPRCFFVGRIWPENYEFPSCAECNSEARLDEQGLAVLVRLGLNQTPKEPDQSEWQELIKAVWNNQPALIEEWRSVNENGQRRNFRKTFGPRGDELRHNGWGTLHLGPLSQALTERFMVKLGQALYYLHNRAPFEGFVYALHISLLDRDIPPNFFKKMMQIAPMRAEPKRANQPLGDQFIYAFNHSEEHGIIHAVVQFSEQYVFQLIAMRSDLALKREELAKEMGSIMPESHRHDIRLKRKTS